jgi:hypothetical protein
MCAWRGEGGAGDRPPARGMWHALPVWSGVADAFLCYTRCIAYLMRWHVQQHTSRSLILSRWRAGSKSKTQTGRWKTSKEK